MKIIFKYKRDRSGTSSEFKYNNTYAAVAAVPNELRKVLINSRFGYLKHLETKNHGGHFYPRINF